jgi:hypothetical protein
MTLSRRRAATMLSAAAVLPLLAVAPAAAADWPLQPRPEVVRGFEPPPARWLPGHRGVDLAGSPGQPVLSATAGTITYAGQLAGRGVIVVSHGQTRTTYEPVVASVRTGATVTSGEPIGRLSAAGSHCSPSPCLHWGLRRGDEYLDPLELLGSLPVRLLPLSGVEEAQSGADPGGPASGPPLAGTADADVSRKGATSGDQTTSWNDREAAAGQGTSDGHETADGHGTADGQGTAGTGAGMANGQAAASADPGTADSQATAGADRGTGTDDSGDGRSGGDAAAGILVGLAAAVTVGSGLLVSRH